MATLTSLTTATRTTAPTTAASSSPVRRSENRIACADGFERERSLGVWLASGKARLVLVAPPGETALLTAMQTRVLSKRLEELATALEGRKAVARGEARS